MNIQNIMYFVFCLQINKILNSKLLKTQLSASFTQETTKLPIVSSLGLSLTRSAILQGAGIELEGIEEIESEDDEG